MSRSQRGLVQHACGHSGYPPTRGECFHCRKKRVRYEKRLSRKIGAAQQSPCPGSNQPVEVDYRVIRNAAGAMIDIKTVWHCGVCSWEQPGASQTDGLINPHLQRDLPDFRTPAVRLIDQLQDAVTAYIAER